MQRSLPASAIDQTLASKLALRPARTVMPVEALSATKAHRLSFARTLVRRMERERWAIDCSRFDIDDRGRGTIVYDIDANGYRLYFLIFSDDVPEENRTGRLSESRFDGMGVLCEGPLTDERIAKEYQEIRKRSRGRTDYRTIGWTLTSRSSRSFEAIVQGLAEGRQPSRQLLQSDAKYLFRNNGYYGNGRHGSRMWSSLPTDHPLGRPYHPEMFALYMWRHFGFDLAERLARRRSPGACQLDPAIKRYLGIGNATGQGMSTFVIKWPQWMHTWNLIRETAVATAITQRASPDERTRAGRLLARCRGHMAEGPAGDDGYFLPKDRLVADLDAILQRLNADPATANPATANDWTAISSWAQGALSRESAEMLHAVLTEVYGPKIDPLDDGYRPGMALATDVIPQMSVGALAESLRRSYGWALRYDIGDPATTRYFFYRSEEQGEQRVGDRTLDAGSQFETFTAVVWAAHRLAADLAASSSRGSVAGFLLRHPEHRFFVERVQSFLDCPYAEPWTNVPGDDFTPVHAIRFVLATFGMETFTAHNHRWVQGTFFQGAPIASDLTGGAQDDWLYPMVPDCDD